MDGDSKLAAEVERAFADDFPQQAALLSHFIEAGDLLGIARHLHSIKGASANVGAGGLGTLTLDAERAAADGDLDRLRALAQFLNPEFDRWNQEYQKGINHEDPDRRR